MELVSQYKAEGAGEEPLRLAVWDFGGQEVFYILHHLFLSRYGVYLVTFNMQWLSSSASQAEREDCEWFLRFWLSSVFSHTWDGKSGAPIVLVGTHKDKVPTRVEHELMSQRLTDLLGEHPAWRLVEGMKGGGGEAGLWFYPVDNTKGSSDPVVAQLMSAVEGLVEAEDYIKTQVHLAWVGVYDDLRREGRTTMRMAELEALGRKHGLPATPGLTLREEVRVLASFFSGLGFIMWFPEPSLADLVVVNPAAFLIGPATKLVCQYGLHRIPEHDTARKAAPVLFRTFTSRGVLDQRLLQYLWAGTDNRRELEVLLVKFGLIVPLVDRSPEQTEDGQRKEGAKKGGEKEKEGKDEAVVRYLVPALLKEEEEGEEEAAALDAKLTCFLLFATPEVMEEWRGNGSVGMAQVRREGFFPAGVFPRLLGKAVALMQHTTRSPARALLLTASRARLSFGAHSFELRALRAEGCVRLTLLVKSSAVTLPKVLSLAREVLAECVRNLRVAAAVPVDGGQGGGYAGYKGELVLLDGERGLWRAAEAGEGVEVEGGRRVEGKELQTRFEGWLPPRGLRSSYDVFLSYRWTGGLDDEIAEGLFFRLSEEVVDGRAVQVFWDRQRLEHGRNFQADFAGALAASRVVVPLVSQRALTRMHRLKAESGCDNLLLEWTLSVVLQQGGVLSALLPIMFGAELDPQTTPKDISADTASPPACVASLFAAGGPGSLPEVMVAAVHHEASAALHSLGHAAQGVSRLEGLSVKGTVGALTKYLGVAAWQLSLSHVPPDHSVAEFKRVLMEEAVRQIMAVLRASASSAPPSLPTPRQPQPTPDPAPGPSGGQSDALAVATAAVEVERLKLQRAESELKKVEAQAVKAKAEAEKARAEAEKAKAEAELARAQASLKPRSGACVIL